MGNRVFDWNDLINYDEQVVGFDVSVDVGSLRARSEGVLRRIEYHDGKSEQLATADGSVQFLPSRLEWSGYALAAYRTPWRLEPFVELELASKAFTLPRFAGSSRASPSNTTSITWSAGLNLEITAYLQVKTQVAWFRIYGEDFDNKTQDVPIIFVRAVDSF